MENKKKLDYDRLLDDWGEDLFKLSDIHADKRDCDDTGSYSHGYHRGMHDGLIMAITKLSILENRRSSKYEMKD